MGIDGEALQRFHHLRSVFDLSGDKEMTRKLAIAATLLAVLTAERAPPRETGLHIPTAQSGQILAACIEKRLGQYTEEDLPGGGISIQYGESKSMFIHRPPTLYFDLTQDGENRAIDIRYRHPMSRGTAAKMLRMVGRKCFPYELDAAGGGRLSDAAG